jgi:hypothetical protein
MIIPILLFALAIEIISKPRLDITENKKLILWYGRKNRNHIFLN